VGGPKVCAFVGVSFLLPSVEVSSFALLYTSAMMCCLDHRPKQ
jgi:hypothetical protein